MSIEEMIDFGSSLDGVLTLRPGPGDGSPELAWGDVFFYYAPDGVMPQATQPFATIVTKDYPDDRESRLDRSGAFRVNLAAGQDEFVRWTGHRPREHQPVDSSVEDTVIAHPVYGPLGWLAVVNPGPQTEQTVRDLFTKAYGLARARAERRAGSRP